MSELRIILPNLRYQVSVDYDNYYPGCDGNDCDICRCSVIENVSVKRPRHTPDVVIKEKSGATGRWRNKVLSEMDKYCIERIFVNNRWFDANSFEVDVGNGYYGEEIIGVGFHNEQPVLDYIRDFMSLDNDIEKLMYVLKLEYSYIADIVKNKKGLVKGEVYCDNLVITNSTANNEMLAVKKRGDAYFMNLDKGIPQCVVVRTEGGKYLVVDGNHRAIARFQEGCEKITCWVLEDNA